MRRTGIFFLAIVIAGLAAPLHELAAAKKKKDPKSKPAAVKIVKASDTKYQGAKIFGETKKKKQKKKKRFWFRKKKKNKVTKASAQKLDLSERPALGVDQ